MALGKVAGSEKHDSVPDGFLIFNEVNDTPSTCCSGTGRDTPPIVYSEVVREQSLQTLEQTRKSASLARVTAIPTPATHFVSADLKARERLHR